MRGWIAAYARDDRAETRGALSLARGDRERAVRDQLRGLHLAEARHEPFHHLGACALTAAMYAELGRPDDAHPLAVRVLSLVREHGLHGALTRLGLFADELGIGDDLREALAARAGRTFPFWRSVIEQILAGELDAAADTMGSAGNLTIEANLRKHQGLRLVDAGRTADAEIELERAFAFYRSVDASFYVAQIESALAGAQSESA